MPRPPGPSARSLGLPGEHPVLALGFEDNVDSVRWQIDRLKGELGRSDLVVVEGEHTLPLWDALNGFQAARAGALQLRGEPPPLDGRRRSSQGLDPGRWSIQAHAGNGIVRAHALGEWTMDEAARAIEPLRQQAVRGGRQPDPLPMPDRLEGTPPRLGRAAGRPGDRRSRPRGPRPPRGHESGPVRGGIVERDRPSKEASLLRSKGSNPRRWPPSKRGDPLRTKRAQPALRYAVRAGLSHALHPRVNRSMHPDRVILPFAT